MRERMQRIAHDFWAGAKAAGVTRGDVEAAVPTVLPMCMVSVPKLTATRAGEWLRTNGIQNDVAGDEPLHGCLLARHGAAYLFVRAEDEAAVRRYTVAHEAAHFLLHHDRPRRRTAAAAGAAALEALDGLRPATPVERLGGVLAAQVIAPHVHLFRGPGEDAAEAEADALAEALLDLPRPTMLVDPVVELARRVLCTGGRP